MALRRRTDAYWQKRAEQRLLASERTTKKYMAELSRTYAEARRRTVKSLQDIYAAYYKKDEGFDMEALRSIVPTGEIKQFMAEMKKLGLKTGLPSNYAGRVNRLRLINAQLKAEAQKVGLKQESIDKRALTEDFTDSYYRAGFDVAKGLGSTPIGFNGLDQQTVNQVLNAKFEGRNFSQRIWRNTDLLADRLRQTLAVAIANGQGIGKTAAEMSRDYNVNRSYAERLIRTESNHFHNEGELEAYKAMGFEQFKFLATLDNRTSEICRDMDGQIFDVSKGIPGENVPPLHPNCRSTIVPYFKEYEPETRLYRDPETGQNKFTYNVPYNDWKASIISSGDTRKQNPKETPKEEPKEPKSYVDENGKVAPGFYIGGNGKVVEVTNRFEVPEYSVHNTREQVSFYIDAEQNNDNRNFISGNRLESFKDGSYKKLDMTEEELVKNLDQYLKEGATFRGTTRHEEQILSAYTHASAPNESLRNGGKVEDDKMAKTVMDVMGRTVGTTGTFYRGLNDAKAAETILGMKVGDVYSDKGFLSTDWRKETAKKFADGGVMLEITNNSKKVGTNLSLSPYSHVFEEQEMLFAPNTQLKIKEIVKEGNLSVYKVEVVEKAETIPVQPKTEGLTKDEKAALEYYVSGDGMYINNHLRSRNGVTPEDMNEQDKEFVRNLDSATSKEVKDSVLYRSVDASAIFQNISQNDYDELKDFFAYPSTVTSYSRAKAEVIMGSKLQRFVDKGFVSTTKDEMVAADWDDFTGSDKPVVLRIKVDKGTKGVDLGFLDVEGEEQKEVLLARNQTFKVGKVSYKEGNIYVDVSVSGASDVKNPDVQPFKTEIGKTASKEVANSFVDRLNNLGQMFPDVANDFNAAGAVIKSNPNMKRSMGFYRYRGNGTPISIEYASSKLKTLETVEKQAEDAQKVGWWMPTSKEHYKDQVVTHEFGHAVQSYLVRQEMKTRSTANSRLADYYSVFGYDKSIAMAHRRQIVSIARKDNPGVDVLKGLSKYGGKNASEFFAETFANAFCGAPNELGKAMLKFLKEKGVYND